MKPAEELVPAVMFPVWAWWGWEKKDLTQAVF